MIRNIIEKELQNIFLFFPVFIGLGIIIFFHLSFDPPSIIGIILVVFCFMLSYLAYRKKGYWLYNAALLLTASCLGFCAASIRTEVVQAPKLKEKTDALKIEATVEQIILSPDGTRLLLSDLDFEHNTPLPKFIRVNVKSDILHLSIGNRVSFYGVLMPNPIPTYPGGFNFTEFAYFKQIGAIGYSVSKIRILDQHDSGITRKIEELRKSIVDRIQKQLPEPESGVAAGLLVGFNNLIDKEVYNYIRISGIAHIIAISGMHIVVVVALTFFIVRYLLTRVGQLALYVDLKKISAVIAIIVSFLYLLLAGSPVSAQRAFIMSAIVLLAIVVDRESKPMRAIAISAILILLFTPETIMSASLQMSFAACIALIASYDFLSKKLIIKNSVLKYAVSVVISSIIAGAATAPFVIYHFNQFSSYGILTNIIAVPMSDFIIMPLGMLSLLLMPFNLEYYSLKLMGYAINLMLQYAKMISELPHASVYIPKFTSYGITLITIGGLILCLMATRVRLSGIVFIIIGMLSLFNEEKPDILVSGDGKLFAIKSGDGHLYASNNNKARFIRGSWQQAYNEPNMLSIKEAMIEECTENYCALDNAFIKFNEGESTPCEQSALLINLTSDDIKCASNTMIITKNELEEKGGHAIWLHPVINIKTTKEFMLDRIWNRH